jgi:FkbM family methyltransferase
MKQVLKKILKKSPIPFTKNHKYDLQTIKVLKKIGSQNSNCIDVGCHKGEILEEILRASPLGTHYCFEPIPKFYHQLVKHFPKNCKFFNLALGDKQETTQFHYVVSNPAYSGFRQIQYARHREQIEQINVNVDLLDNIIPIGLKIDFMKIDVEGAEMQVLRGAQATILRNKPIIVFEHGKGAANFYNTEPADIYNFLTQDCQLKVALLSQYLNQKDALKKVEFIRQFYERLNYYFIAYP